MNEFDKIWSGLVELIKLDAQRIKEQREQRRLRRNELARARYKKSGRKPKQEKPVEPEYDPPDSCYCSATSHPPCGWCERGISEEE